MDANASNVLLCLRYGIGDLITELPAIDRLREHLPHARITGLGAEPAIEILDHDPRLDAVLPIQHWGIRHLGDPANEATQRQFADWLAASRFDLVLDPSHAAEVVRQIILEQDVAIRDSDPACLEAGLAQGMDGLSAVRHAIRQGWGLEIPASHDPKIFPTPEELEWARQFLDSSRLASPARAGDRLIAISPGASHALKRWPTDRFAGLCRFVVERLEAGILLFCGPGETRLLRDLIEQTTDLPDIEIVQDLHLRHVAALLSRCSLYVGNDSGLMHLAAAAQTPVVALFGPTFAHLYLPRWIPSRAVVSSAACPYRRRRAFGHSRCVLAGRCLTGAPCIDAIELREVCEGVKETWEQARNGPREA
jgi:ADP-heptose:LPS heptosyltransferase